MDKGPVLIARESPDGKIRTVVMGFDPFAGPMRFELATPLLLANILRWIAPDVFRDVDVGAQSAGPVAMPLAGLVSQAAGNSSVQVMTDNGANLPFNVRDRSVEFFAGQPERVRVLTGNSERVYSLTLPELWDVKWTPPANIRHGIPLLDRSPARQSGFVALAGPAGHGFVDCRVDHVRALFQNAPARSEISYGADRMSFERGWVLLLLVLPLIWMAWEWRRQTRHAPLLLKVAMIMAVLLALSQPQLQIHDSKVAVAVLVDTSASVSDADLTKESDWLKKLDRLAAATRSTSFRLPAPLVHSRPPKRLSR